MATTPTTSSRSALRRYPALAYLAGAVALALLLPSGLNVPNSGPSSLAEYAPVPGQGVGTGNESALGTAAGGSGIGFGEQGTQAADAGSPSTTVPAGGGRTIKHATLKHCVGSPPRQTEDLLSPPCVAFFDGDNGGATAKGVTRDEVRLVIYLGGTVRSSDSFVDCLDGPAGDDTPEDSACKGFQHFFNDRYQTYGRTVHVWNYHAATSVTGTDFKARMAAINQAHDPFMVVGDLAANSATLSGASNPRVIAVSFSGDTRKTYQNNAPWFMSFRPDADDQRSMVASFICSELAGRPPRLAGAGVTAKQRKFGVLYNNNAPTPALVPLLKSECNLDVITGGSVTGQQGVSYLHAQGVTTVIPLENFQTVTRDATSQEWFPEWIIPGQATTGNVDTNASARTADPAQWPHAFGITFDYRRDAANDQAWYRGYREGCSSCPASLQTGQPGSTQPAVIYDMLAEAFYGIQAAGPKLTSASVDKGMHAIPPNGSPSPYRPAAYFTPGNYTFVKDGATIWWDPNGLAPGDPTPGCYRLVLEGKRRRAGEWPIGDDELQRPTSAPCQGTLG